MTTSYARPSSQDNAQLRRELARARAEGRNKGRKSETQSSPPLSGANRHDRTMWIRVMLSDRHSRNP